MGKGEEEDYFSWSNILERALTTILVAVVLGAGSAYITVKMTLADMNNRISSNEGRIEEIGNFNSQLRGERKKLIDRLARIEENQEFIKERLSRAYNDKK